MYNYQLVNSNEKLAELCRSLDDRPVVALDTEFIRVSTFYPKAGLFQLNDGDRYALIDPLAIDEWQPFADFLQNDGIVKVLHSCDEDIELFYHAIGVIASNVFDTQVAAAFANLDYGMGYQRLVESLCQVSLVKSSSRSDWLQRPLSDTQIEYALADVNYLIPMHQLLHKKIMANGLSEALAEEYQQVVASITDSAFSCVYKRIKSGWKLDSRQTSRLKALAAWRETMMREYDMPRNHVATNEALLCLAKKSHWLEFDLFQVDGLSNKVIRKSAPVLLALLAGNYELTEPIKRPIKRDKLHSRIKHRLSRVVQETPIAEAMLIRKSMVDTLHEAIVTGTWELPSSISGWRQVYYQQVLTTFKVEKESREV